MTLNNFNSKVNLPKVCAGLGYTDYQFIKLPTFGWYAFNRDKTFVGNIYDIMPQDDHGNLFSYILKNKPGYLDFVVPYSEVSDLRLRSNVKLYQAWSACYAMAKVEAEKYGIKVGGVKIPLKTIYENQGLPYIIGNSVGVVTNMVREKFSFLPWPKNSIGKLLVPTFCTPRHICSLELFDAQTLDNKTSVYTNDEKGWYGTLGTKIVKNFKEIATSKGNTWDYKCDYWNDKVLEISDLLGIQDYIKIWTEARTTIFSKSPLTYIVESGKTDELKNHVTNLSYAQIAELEKATGESLNECWKRSREEHIQLGSTSFVKRDNCYYIQKRSGLMQVTNFTIDITNIEKRGNDFIRIGHIYFKDKIIPCEIESKYFVSHYKFRQGMNQKFFEYGLGVPIISPQFEHNIIQIINSFNENALITTQ